MQLLQSLPAMSLAISIVVVICMAISFAVLFFLYGKTKSKGIAFGVEDGGIEASLNKSKGKYVGETKTYSEVIAANKKRERTVRIVTDAFLFALIAVAAALTIFSFVLRSRGEQIYFGDTAYLTVLTSSMQEKNANNDFLKDNDDGIRIHQFALIGIKKTDVSQIKEGDIIAFKYDDEVIYVHRVVKILDRDGERFFTTMGDANSVSAVNETNISSDRIVGVFNGYHNGFLGILLIYLRSDIGMVALLFVFALLSVIDLSEILITRSYEKRQRALAAVLDGEKSVSPVEPEPIAALPVSVEPIVPVLEEFPVEAKAEEYRAEGESASIAAMIEAENREGFNDPVYDVDAVSVHLDKDKKDDESEKKAGEGDD